MADEGVVIFYNITQEIESTVGILFLSLLDPQWWHICIKRHSSFSRVHLGRESLLLTTRDGLSALAETTRPLNLTAALKRNGFSEQCWTTVAQIQLVLHFAPQFRWWELVPSGSGFIILVIGVALVAAQQRWQLFAEPMPRFVALASGCGS